MQINNLAMDAGPDIYYDKDFRRTLEAHIPYLKKHPTSTILTVTPDIVQRYEFDFYGLLAYYNIPAWMHWIILRMNDFVSPSIFPIEITEILMPLVGTVDQIQQIYNTSHSPTT